MYISLFTVAIPINYDYISELWEIFKLVRIINTVPSRHGNERQEKQTAAGGFK